MACALGIEQDCNECRMCGNGKGGKEMTNFERIKGMILEKLAELLVFYDGCYWYEKVTDTCCWTSREKAVKAVKEWLESECDAE